MKTTCKQCYHYKNYKCTKVNARVNIHKHRPNCKMFITKQQYNLNLDKQFNLDQSKKTYLEQVRSILTKVL